MFENKEYGSVEEYIKQQPEDRQEVLNKLREIFRNNLPKELEERIQYGMISYVIPHSVYPAGYHTNPSDPLPYISLGNQKGHVAVYHMAIYTDKDMLEWFEKEYAALEIGKLNMGKSCIRFRNTKKIPYELIKELSKKTDIKKYIEMYEEYLSKRKNRIKEK